MQENTQVLADYFSSGRRDISVHTAQDVQAILLKAPEGMRDLTAIPVEDADGVLRGVLSACGLLGQADCVAMLKSVGFSFTMLCENTNTYRKMQHQGERDALTGLYNRNRYEMDLPHIALECNKGVCCVFIDANGLHELNNDCGHEAGDDMLRRIAKEISNHFNMQYAYRVGGDEFIIFAIDETELQVTQQSQSLTSTLEQEGYHVSAGVAWFPAPVKNLEALVKSAEKRMYTIKDEYYRNLEHKRRAR